MPEIELQVNGAARQLATLAQRLRDSANQDLRLELLRGIRKAASPVPAAARRSARETLPRRGGLAELVATSKISTRTRTTGAAVGVRVVGTSRHDIQAMDLGMVRHPLYGNKEYWFEQPTKPLWWTNPTRAAGAEARPDVEAVIVRIKERIEG